MKKIILLIALFSLAGITEAQSSKSLLKILVQKGILTEKEADTVSEKATALKTLVQKGILTVREADLLRVQPIDEPQKWEYCSYRIIIMSGPGYTNPLESMSISLPNDKNVSLVYSRVEEKGNLIKGDHDNYIVMKAAIDGFTKDLKDLDIILNIPKRKYTSKTIRHFYIYILNALGNSQWELISHTKTNLPQPPRITTKTLEEIYILKRKKLLGGKITLLEPNWSDLLEEKPKFDFSKPFTIVENEIDLAKEIVGSYESGAFKYVYLKNGTFEFYFLNALIKDGQPKLEKWRKQYEGKWIIFGKEIRHIHETPEAPINIYKREHNGDLISIARIAKGKREDYTKEKQHTYKKIK